MLLSLAPKSLTLFSIYKCRLIKASSHCIFLVEFDIQMKLDIRCAISTIINHCNSVKQSLIEFYSKIKRFMHRDYQYRKISIRFMHREGEKTERDTIGWLEGEGKKERRWREKESQKERFNISNMFLSVKDLNVHNLQCKKSEKTYFIK